MQSPSVGRDVLIVYATDAKDVSYLIKCSAKSSCRSQVLKASHGSVSIFDPSIVPGGHRGIPIQPTAKLPALQMFLWISDKLVLEPEDGSAQRPDPPFALDRSAASINTSPYGEAS